MQDHIFFEVDHGNTISLVPAKVDSNVSEHLDATPKVMSRIECTAMQLHMRRYVGKDCCVRAVSALIVIDA